MALWLIPAGMAAAGFVKGEMDRKRQEKQNVAQGLAAAAQTEYSPLTGHGPGQFTPKATTSGVDGAMKWGMAGMQTMQGMENAQLSRDLAKARVANQNMGMYGYQQPQMAMNWQANPSGMQYA